MVPMRWVFYKGPPNGIHHGRNVVVEERLHGQRRNNLGDASGKHAEGDDRALVSNDLPSVRESMRERRRSASSSPLGGSVPRTTSPCRG